ncbi:MAG TPA: hypothetical protein VEZ90_18220 [Blastocatellia bacterium]|nr:hypothetical protein [Blastocatellia bacterium]
MSEHISNERIDGYQQGRLGPDELLSVGEHLAECAACRELMVDAGHLQEAVSAVARELEAATGEHPAHLSPEQIAAYVDDRLDDAALKEADTHLEVCSGCYVELMELRRLKPIIDSFIPREPGQSRWLASGGKPHLSSPSWVRRQAAQVAAVAMLLFIFMAALWLRREVTRLNGRIVELQQRNDALQARVSETKDKKQAESQGMTDALRPSSPIVVALNDGEGVITLDRHGHLDGFKSLPGDYEQLIKAALVNQRVQPPRLIAGLLSKPEALLGPTDNRERFSLISPISRVIETDRPVFRWKALEGASSYYVTVRNSSSKEAIVSPMVSGTDWTPPGRLVRGALYAWEVTALREGKELTVPIAPMPQARFYVLEQRKLDELNQARRKYAGSQLMLGILYVRAGLLDQAEQSFESLVAANPDSVTAKRLLRNLKAENHR